LANLDIKYIIPEFPLDTKKSGNAMTSGNLSAKLTEQIGIAAQILKDGGIVAYPTDTVYGLGANARIAKAVNLIYKVKQRPLNLPLPILLADKSDLEKWVNSVPGIANALIARFWPGALTLVLESKRSLPAIAGTSTIAIRIPAHPVPLALIKMIGSPLIGTSANISGQPNTLTASEVKAQLEDRIDFIIDGGPCPGGLESTVVDVTGSKPIILRRGAIPESDIIEITNKYQVNEVMNCV
jgi:L-threonylcarbamoyladenylate synthase